MHWLYQDVRKCDWPKERGHKDPRNEEWSTKLTVSETLKRYTHKWWKELHKLLHTYSNTWTWACMQYAGAFNCVVIHLVHKQQNVIKSWITSINTITNIFWITAEPSSSQSIPQVDWCQSIFQPPKGHRQEDFPHCRDGVVARNISSKCIVTASWIGKDVDGSSQV